MDKCDEKRQLSVKQERALELIILGQNDREVAESLSIARQTVHKWRNYNLRFVRICGIHRKNRSGASLHVRLMSFKRILRVRTCAYGKQRLFTILKSGRLYGEGVKPNSEITEVEVHHSWQFQPWPIG